jgi:hypothetical protein
LLRKVGRHGRLAQRQQDVFAVERERHDRQRDQEARPQTGAQRAPHPVRITRPERLCDERRDRRHQSHADSEADEIYRAGQRGRGNGFIAEAPDEGEIGRHHRDLSELRQRHRHREPQRLGQFSGKMRAGKRRDLRGGSFAVDVVDGNHAARLASLAAENVSVASRLR